jgi:hypothetical protein
MVANRCQSPRLAPCIYGTGNWASWNKESSKPRNCCRTKLLTFRSWHRGDLFIRFVVGHPKHGHIFCSPSPASPSTPRDFLFACRLCSQRYYLAAVLSHFGGPTLGVDLVLQLFRSDFCPRYTFHKKQY